MENCGYNVGILSQPTKLEIVSPDDRLESWKSVAAYLNRSVRTVRRWEEKEGLPVHRLHHDKRGSIYAYRVELDVWRDSRRQLLEVEPDPPGALRHVSRAWWWTAAALLLATGSAGAYRILRPPSRTPPGFTSNPEAYRAYQKARFGLNAGRTQVQSGIKYYQEAIRLDPGFAAAWAGLASAHAALTWFGDVPARETLSQARLEAEKAMALNRSSGSPWRVLGLTSHLLDWDHAAAEKQFRKAIELSPRESVAASWFAEFLIDLGRSEEAQIYARRAQDNEPRWLEAITVAGNIHAFSGNPDLAIAEYQRALEIDPSYALGNHFLGRAYLAKGQFPNAIAQLRRSNELLGKVPFSIADLGYALAAGGQRSEAEKLLTELMRKRSESYAPSFAIAEIHLGLDHTDSALDWLERAAEERNLGYYLPSVDPIYERLRSQPRFQALMRKVGGGRVP